MTVNVSIAVLENENQPENKVIKAYHDMDPEEIDSCLINDYKKCRSNM